uniref:Angiopoietin-related protein 7-like n=1 Tax=Seriola lalandi dorsalis TaxID=1841481 RepID=A0A3B4Y644_SERLL
MRGGNTGVDASNNQTSNQTVGASSAQCGEYSSQLMSNGQCRLMATLPPVGTSQKRCPDMFRCTDDISYWLHENQNRKEQLEELRETMSELQEELRNHQHRVKFECCMMLCKALSLCLCLSPSDGRYLSFCPSDCASLYYNGVRRSGVYTIVLSPGATLPVYCDMETEGGGWTVFQRRRDGTVSFNRGWSEYRDGFGEPRGEHWLGNQNLHLLSNQGHYSLRIDLQDWSHAHRHALYHSFRIEDEENQYRLHVSGFSGTVEDSFGWYHDQQGFSTPDTGNICAEISHSGWWFHQCFYANLNGVYYKVGLAKNLLGPDGIVWFSWKDSDFYSLKAVTMMIRPRNYRPRLSP